MNRNNDSNNNKYSYCTYCNKLFLKSHLKGHQQICIKNNKINTPQKQKVNQVQPIQQQQQNHTNIKNEAIRRNAMCNYGGEAGIIQVYKKTQLNQQVTPYYNDSVLNHFFNQYEKIFAKYVENKSVVIVGPAQSILNTNNGHIIDKFDIVIRLNKSLPLPEHLKNDIGTKTDIIYNSLNRTDYPGQNNLDTNLYKNHGVSFVCSSYPFNHTTFHDDIASYVYKYRFDIPLKVMNDGKFRNFENSLKTRPYTGTCAIMDLLSYPIKHLYITGLDFYETKYYSEYRKISKTTQKYNKNSAIHQSKPQLDYLKNASLFDNRILLDSFLDNLLYHDYYRIIKNLMEYNKDEIFYFHDMYLKKYFELKLSTICYTKRIQNFNTNNDPYPFFIFTDNQHYQKKENEYCIFITTDKSVVNNLNNNLASKKFIGNFYYTNKLDPSISLHEKFIKFIKHQLNKINIQNCNLNILLLLAILLFFEDKHFFSYNEIINNWNISHDEKKWIHFLIKKQKLFIY